MPARSLLTLFLVITSASAVRGEEPTARVVASHGYSQAVELKLGTPRVVSVPDPEGVPTFLVQIGQFTSLAYLGCAAASQPSWFPCRPYSRHRCGRRAPR